MSPELEIPFDAMEYDLYRQEEPTSKYAHVRWPLPRGRTKHGEFPVIVVREHFRQLGYTVWASEPELPDDSGFILVSYPGKRRARHPAFVRMEEIFGEDVVAKLNRKADEEKEARTPSASGGDPDLFAFRASDRFFVEVKHKDEINLNQAISFSLIEEICKVEVKLARIVEAEFN